MSKVKDRKHSADKQKSDSMLLAKMYTNPICSSALTIDDLNSNKLDFATLARELEKKVNKIIDGDLCGIECMLMTQAITLNVIFNNLTRLITRAEYIPQLQVYSDIALKSQNQCRQTLAVLAELKNPKRTMFVKQQNLAINQQVNNETATINSEKTGALKNELLSIEAKKHETLDNRRAFTSINTNPEMETVEASRSENPRRKSD